MATKLKACPWCGWRAAIVMTIEPGKHMKYSVKCGHCGLEGKRSRFALLARHNWNHTHVFVSRTRKERKYHIYGREF